MLATVSTALTKDYNRVVRKSTSQGSRLSERKRKITMPDGTDHEATEVGFRNSGEYFNEYLLDDGSVVRFKAVVTSVARIDDMWDASGEPVYLVESTNVMKVSAPSDLRRDKS